MNLTVRLTRARESALEGRYEEALHEYMWFHDHALEHDRSMYGVRLSFALEYWHDLAKVYPRAMDELESLRYRKSKLLLDGDANRELFHDVVSINQQLEQDERTCELFKGILSIAPEFAEKCASLALPSLMKMGEFELARHYVGDPFEKVRKLGKEFNRDIEHYKKSPHRSDFYEAFIHNYAQAVILLIKILNGVGDGKNSINLRKSSLEVIQSDNIRQAVDVELKKRYENGLHHDYVGARVP